MSTQPLHPDRFHALDATRAFALLLGIVFHAAWTFTNEPAGAPIVDVSGNIVFSWFFTTSHTFRMQLFFLIAGFFARLLLERRGTSGFVRNRFMRIVIPMVIAWFILVPLIISTWIWGSQVSGASPVLAHPLAIGGYLLSSGLLFVTNSKGGSFSLTHLWFLYYLAWIYVVAIGLRWLTIKSGFTSQKNLKRIDALVRHIAQSGWSVLWLSLLTALCLLQMKGWRGVDTPTKTLVPSMQVILLYGSFFLLGWLIHRQVRLLTDFKRHWRWQMLVALVLSFGVFAISKNMKERGYGNNGWSQYPIIEYNQISDWPSFITLVQSGADPNSGMPEMKHMWAKMAELSQLTIAAAKPEASPEVQAGVCRQISGMLGQAGLFETPGNSPSEQVSLDEIVLANRHAFEKLASGMLIGDPREFSWYYPLKFGYSYLYSLVMWLLVFGSIGFFQSFFSGHSQLVRYIADSSYWVYLLHIPLVPFFQIWMSQWEVSGFFKFALLNAISFSLLIATYHYFVRSTVVGKLLNGKTYPFTWLPWHPETHASDSARHEARSVPAAPDPETSK